MKKVAFAIFYKNYGIKQKKYRVGFRIIRRARACGLEFFGDDGLGAGVDGLCDVYAFLE